MIKIPEVNEIFTIEELRCEYILEIGMATGIAQYYSDAFNLSLEDGKRHPLAKLEQKTNRKLPYFPEIKALSEFFNATFDLCEKVYWFKDIDYKPYWRDGNSWYRDCIFNYFAIHFIDTFNNRLQTKTDIVNRWKKRLSILKKKEFLSSQKSLVLPQYNPWASYGKYSLALDLMIEGGFTMSNQSNDFNRYYWQEYINAMQKYIIHLEEKSILTQVQSKSNGIHYIQRIGKGNSTKNTKKGII